MPAEGPALLPDGVWRLPAPGALASGSVWRRRRGGGAGQEKQLAPTLLSFFIYNPKLGPKEGEVPERGVASRGCGERRAAPGPALSRAWLPRGGGPGRLSRLCRPSPRPGPQACARGINASPPTPTPRRASPNKGGRWGGGSRGFPCPRPGLASRLSSAGPGTSATCVWVCLCFGLKRNGSRGGFRQQRLKYCRWGAGLLVTVFY